MPYIIFIAFFCLAIGLRQGALMDPDTGWHIAAGDLIRAAGRLPETDPWSYTAGDHIWYNIAWAFDVGLSILHSAGGLPAVVVASALLYAIAVAAAGAIALRSADSVIAATITTALAGFVVLSGMLARPQLITFLLALSYYAILRFGSARALLLLPVLTIVWTNAHGGFLVGFVIIGMFFIEAAASKNIKKCIRLGGIGGACAIATVFNPYGWRILEATQLSMNSVMSDVLLEWRPADFSAPSAAMFFLGAFVIVSGLFERRIPLADKLLACFWLAAGLMMSRMFHLAALLGTPYLAQALALRLRQSPIGAAFDRRDGAYQADLARPVVKAVFAGMSVLVAAAAFAPPVQRQLAAKGERFVEIPAHNAPDAALDFAKSHYPKARLFAKYSFGGYLVYRERGALPLFVDGRADTAYPRPVLEDAITIGFMDRRVFTSDVEAAWRVMVAKYQIEGFLTSKGARLHAYLSRNSEWTNVYEDDVASLFMRSDVVDR